MKLIHPLSLYVELGLAGILKGFIPLLVHSFHSFCVFKFKERAYCLASSKVIYSTFLVDIFPVPRKSPIPIQPLPLYVLPGLPGIFEGLIPLLDHFLHSCTFFKFKERTYSLASSNGKKSLFIVTQ